MRLHDYSEAGSEHSANALDCLEVFRGAGQRGEHVRALAVGGFFPMAAGAHVGSAAPLLEHAGDDEFVGLVQAGELGHERLADLVNQHRHLDFVPRLPC